jgi:protein-S-isoprenylcysteine O-methyltransferase Ste14
MQISEDSAQVRFPPPFVYAGFLLLGLALGRLLGRPAVGLVSVTGSVTGALLILVGFGVMLAAIGLFRRRGTNLEPWLPATSLVASGIYRWTRNPMYLGMALIYAGLALILDSLSALLLLPVVVIVIQTQVIAREERYLDAKFGDAYRAYTAKVRRWL